MNETSIRQSLSQYIGAIISGEGTDPAIDTAIFLQRADVPNLEKRGVDPLIVNLLKIIYTLADENIQVSYDTVKTRCSLGEIAVLDYIYEQYKIITSRHGVIRSTLSVIAAEIAVDDFTKALQSAENHVRVGPGTLSNRIEEAILMVQQASTMVTPEYNFAAFPNAAENFYDDLVKRHEQLMSGRFIHPTFKLSGLGQKLLMEHGKPVMVYPSMYPGSVALLTARTKSGKTAVALKFAQMFAHSDDQQFDVLVLYGENDPTTMWARIVSPDVVLHNSYLQTPVGYHPSAFKDRILETRAKFRKNNIERGVITAVHMPLMTISNVSSVVNHWAQGLRENNRKGVVIIDYLHLVSMGVSVDSAVDDNSQAGVINAIANTLKVIFERQQIPCLLLAQSDEQGNVRYGRRINERAQFLLHMESEENEMKESVKMLDRNGNPVHDAMGQPIYWHMADDMYTHKRTLILKQANTFRAGRHEFKVALAYGLVKW